jgi:hypothetical protein
MITVHIQIHGEPACADYTMGHQQPPSAGRFDQTLFRWSTFTMPPTEPR